jgi:hypothetical protein
LIERGRFGFALKSKIIALKITFKRNHCHNKHSLFWRTPMHAFSLDRIRPIEELQAIADEISGLIASATSYAQFRQQLSVRFFAEDLKTVQPATTDDKNETADDLDSALDK